MTNPYLPPQSAVADVQADADENTSGTGRAAVLPPGVKGWSWGAFLLNGVWAIGNRSWIGLLSLLPMVGFLMAIYLGVKGREMAWRNKRWESLAHFNQVQRRWSKWGWILSVLAVAITVLGNLGGEPPARY